MNYRIITTALISISALHLTQAATANDATVENTADSSLTEVIDRCAKVKAPTERLQCYDALAASLRPVAAATEEANDSDRGQPDTAKSPPKQETIAERERRFIIVDADSVEGKKVTRDAKKRSGEPFSAVVAAAKRNNTGKLFVQFDDGQIWRTLEGAGDIGVPAKGETAQLKKSMFFSWWVTFGDGKRVKMVPFNIDD